MSLRVLVTDGMDAGAVAQLRADGFEIVEKFYEPDELGTALKEFDAVIIRSATKIKKQQIDDAKGGNLKLIIRAGVGMDNIDIPYAEAAGIQVKNTPRSSSNAVAELAIPAVLLRTLRVCRRLLRASAEVGEERLLQGLRSHRQDHGRHRLRPHRPDGGHQGAGSGHERSVLRQPQQARGLRVRDHEVRHSRRAVRTV